MMKFAVKSAFLFVISLFIFSLATRNVSASTVVSPTNMNGWAFQVLSVDGSGTFVTGPVEAPIGTGSARLFTGTQGNAATSLHNNSFNGIEIDDITMLEYSTYASVANGSSESTPILVIHVTTGTGPDVLQFNPNSQSTPSLLNQWQTWNGLNGFWTSSSFAAFPGGTISQYSAFVKSFDPSDILVTQKVDGTGGLRFQAGPGSASNVFDGNVDNFTIGINGSDTTYDFEPMVATNDYSAQNYSDNNFQNPVGGATVPTGTLLPNQSGYRLANNWGMGSPAPGVPVNNFSVAWEGTFDFSDSKYNFVGYTDNALRIIVDGNTVVDRTSRGVGIGARMMTDGVHTVRVEYVHGTGPSNVNFAFYKINPPMPFTGSCLDLTGDGVVNVADQGVLNSIRLNLIDGNLGNDPGPETIMAADMNGDSIINVADQGILASKHGVACPYN